MTASTCQHLMLILVITLITGCSSDPTEPIIPQSTVKPIDPFKGLTQPIVPHTPKKKSTYQRYQSKKTGKPIGNYSATRLSGVYSSSAAAHNFIRKVAKRSAFTQDYLQGLFSKAQHLASVVKLEGPRKKIKTTYVPSAGSWSRYRKKFLTSTHINHGVRFWHDNASSLQKASTRYKVDPEYIVAIIGVETFFGRNVGKTRTLDALSTLAFHTQRRAKYFSAELENFLLMTVDEGYDPQEIVGSWAGAMGLGQFMPSSFLKLAIDFNQDGRRDLWNPVDAIGSVANYFSHHRWQYKRPVTTKTSGAGTDVGRFRTYSGDEYWRLHPNFKVIKKYNHSNHYAMAVHQLAQAIKQRYR